MKNSKPTKRVPSSQKAPVRASKQAKSKPKIQLKTLVKQREKFIKEKEMFSQEYCQRCDLVQACYTNAERKEFQRQHADHKLSLLQKIKRRWFKWI
jgi:hypothetical protein